MRKVTKKKVADLEREIEELERKTADLEELSKQLQEKLGDVSGHFNKLLVKFGRTVRETIDGRVDECIDDIEYRILKKLVDGKYFELKMRENNGHRKVKEND